MRIVNKDLLSFTLALVCLLALSCGGSGGSDGMEAPPVAGLSFTSQPTDTVVDGAMNPVVQVEVRDDQGALITSPVSVSIAIDSNAVNAQLSGTLTVNSVNGVATFNDLSVNLHGSGYTLTATSDTQQVTSTPFDIELHEDFISLTEGFKAELYAESQAFPVKMALAPDGRLFFAELKTGNIRVIDASGNLDPTPWATVPVDIGAERGLIALALSPDFDTNGYIYVRTTLASPDRQSVVRLEEVGGAGTNATTIIDDLPAAQIHNGGDIVFLDDGTMLISIGDTNDEDLAQTDSVQSGRILRFNADGTIPNDNHIANDPEYCRGLRNTFGLTVHPTLGHVMGVENGPNSNDEMNFITQGKNYGWPSLPQSVPGSEVGTQVQPWPTVIVPTDLCWHDGTMFGAAYADNLFVCAYDDGTIYRMPMSGQFLSDVDDQISFAQFDEATSTANKPLDILMMPDGSLLISTFTDIWRISRP